MGAGGPLQTDFARYRHGQENPKLTDDVPSAIIIRQGHMVILDGGVGNPPKSTADLAIPGDVADALAGRQQVAAEFFGVSSQRSLDSETKPIRCGTGAVYEFKAAPGTYNIGGLVGPDATATEMKADTVVPVSNRNEAIGKVARGAGDSKGAGLGLNPVSCFVEIFSTVFDSQLP